MTVKINVTSPLPLPTTKVLIDGFLFRISVLEFPENLKITLKNSSKADYIK